MDEVVDEVDDAGTCPVCERGILVRHPDRRLECTNPDCDSNHPPEPQETGCSGAGGT